MAVLSGALPKPSYPLLLRVGHPLARGLVGAWPLAETDAPNSGAQDLSPNNNSAVWVQNSGGVPSNPLSPFGYSAKSFGGGIGTGGARTALKATPVPAYNVGANASAAIWINAATIGAGGVGFDYGQYDSATNNRGWFIGRDQTVGNLLQVNISADGGAVNLKNYKSTDVIADNTWHHAAFAFSPNSLKIYVDGKLQVPTKTTDGTVNSIFAVSSSISLGIGGMFTNTGAVQNNVTNTLAVALFWNRTLSDDEIAWVYYDTFAMFRRPSWRSVAAAAAASAVGRGLTNSILIDRRSLVA